MASPLPTGQELCSFTEQYLRLLPNPDLATKEGTLYLLTMPQKKLQNARSAYANYCATRETALILIDTTAFGSGKTGILMTDQSLYYSNGQTMSLGPHGTKRVQRAPGSLALDSIQRIEIATDPELPDTLGRIIRVFVPDRPEIFDRIVLNRSEFIILKLYIENFTTLTSPNQRSLAKIEPWRDAPWLNQVYRMSEAMLNELSDTLILGEQL